MCTPLVLRIDSIFWVRLPPVRRGDTDIYIYMCMCIYVYICKLCVNQKMYINIYLYRCIYTDVCKYVSAHLFHLTGVSLLVAGCHTFRVHFIVFLSCVDKQMSSQTIDYEPKTLEQKKEQTLYFVSWRGKCSIVYWYTLSSQTIKSEFMKAGFGSGLEFGAWLWYGCMFVVYVCMFGASSFKIVLFHHLFNAWCLMF